MFQNFNAVSRLGRDSEQRFTPNGKAILNFSIPVESGYGDNKKTFWLNCAVFGKQAEGKLVEYLKKGQEVAVSGELSLREWTDKQGQIKTQAELAVHQIQLVGGKREGSQDAGYSSSAQSAAPGKQQDNDFDFNEEVPF